MKNNIKRATAKLSKNGKYLLVDMEGEVGILNANLVRYLFDIPYTRKNGKHVSSQEIFQMKVDAQAAYDRKVSQKGA